MWKLHKNDKKANAPISVVPNTGSNAALDPNPTVSQSKSNKLIKKVLKIITLGGRSRLVAPIVFVLCFAAIGTYLLVGSHANSYGWADWVQLPPGPGTTYSAPAAISWGPGRQDLFARGNDNGLYHKWWQGGGWTGWEQLSGPGTTYDQPTVSSWAPGRLDLFVRGTDDSIYHKAWQGNGWTGWEALGGDTYSAPTAVSWGPNRIDLFVRGTNNAVYHKWWNGSSWSGWVPISAVNATYSSPAVSSWGAGRLDVFDAGTDYGVYHMYWNGSSWSGWDQVSLPGTTYSGPAAVSRGSNQIDLFVRGTNNAVFHKLWTGSFWTAWDNAMGTLPNTTYSTPAIAFGPLAGTSYALLNLFVQGTDNAIYWKTYTPAPTEPSVGSSLPIGRTLPAGYAMYSPSNTYRAVMQPDGNLVVYQNSTEFPIWNTRTSGANVMNFQSDGNLVVRSSSGAAVWASNSYNYGGTTLNMQDDGNLVIYTPNGRAVWSWGTGLIGQPPPPPPAVSLSSKILTNGVASSYRFTGSTIIPYGKAPLLYYSSTDATACYINGSQVALNGSIYEPIPTTSTNYVFTCNGQGGTASTSFNVIVVSNAVKGYPSVDEAVQLNDINQLRSSHGLKTLVDTDCLNQAARAWSQYMASSGLNSDGTPVIFAHSGWSPSQGGLGQDLSLNFCNTGSNGYLVEENIAWRSLCNNAQSDNCSQLNFNALKDSPGHYANMVNSSITNVGVGVYRGSNGYMFVTHEFMSCNSRCPDATIPGYGYH